MAEPCAPAHDAARGYETIPSTALLERLDEEGAEGAGPTGDASLLPE